MARPSKYPRELRERAVRAIAESMARGEYPSEFEAIRTVADQLGIGSAETLRKWVRQAEVDGGQRPGKSTEELAEIPTVCGSLREALDTLAADHEFLLAGNVFTKDQIEGYMALKWQEVYAFEPRLSALCPGNNNVRPKIRQQLQVLRDQGVLEFLGRGNYRKLV